MTSRRSTSRITAEGLAACDFLFDYLKEYVEEHGYGPTQREIAREVGLNTSTVQNYLRRLEEEGRISNAPGTLRAVKIHG